MTTVLIKDPQIITTTLPNGFRVIYEKSFEKRPVSSINVFCDLGSIYEKPGYNGVSHFIEHMCFKGTKKMPESKQILEFFDKNGASINASTFKRYTSYVVKTQDEHLERSIEILSDIMLNSVFKKSEFKKEIAVVIAENTKNADDSATIITDMVDKLIYSGSSYENPVDTLSYHTKTPFNYNTVLNVYKAFYQPSRMVLSIVSNVPYNMVLKYIRSSYYSTSKIPKQVIASNNNCNIEAILDASNPYYVKYSFNPQSQILYDVLRKPGLSNTHLMISFRTCSMFNKDKYILQLIGEIIGGNMSSRLFTILREENGLTYQSSITSSNFEKMGDIAFFAVADNKKIIRNGTKKGVLPLIIKLINDLIVDGITNKELVYIKSNFKGSVITNTRNADIAAYNARQLLLKCQPYNIDYIRYGDTYDKRLKNITLSEINDCICRYFKPEYMTVCLVGGEHVPSLSIIEKECNKIRSV
jgi:predicted Zn-dependent peptidase